MNISQLPVADYGLIDARTDRLRVFESLPSARSLLSPGAERAYPTQHLAALRDVLGTSAISRAQTATSARLSAPITLRNRLVNG